MYCSVIIIKLVNIILLNEIDDKLIVCHENSNAY